MISDKESKTDHYLKIFGGIVLVVTSLILILILYLIVSAVKGSYNTLRYYPGPDSSIFNTIGVILSIIWEIISDWIFLIFIYLFIMIVISWLVTKNIQNYQNIKKGIIIGSLVGGAISLAIISYAILADFSGVLSGGVYAWYVLGILPLILGYPSIIVGAVLGMLVTWIYNKINSTNSR